MSYDVDTSGTRPFPKQMGAIQFDHVSFKYRNQEVPALDQVSFTVQPGEKIAVVGENGAGKTTLVKLLTCFYPVQNGQITIDGVPLTDFDIEDLRANVGAVFQDFSKFLLPLGESIGLGAPNRMHDESVLAEATHASGFDQVMRTKHLTMATQLGQQFAKGIDLSGGEWQKLAIARAFMAESQLLILDEPTAALDPRSEYEVYQPFIELAKGRTVFLITHRLAAVQLADKVLVMRNGRVVAFGTHAELMVTCPYYAELYRMQADGYQQTDN